ncbi:MAG: DUF4261 domain-containing protein [Aureispira sp.]
MNKGYIARAFFPSKKVQYAFLSLFNPLITVSTPPDFKKEQTIVIGIPGQWENQDAIVRILNQHADYSYAGISLLHQPTKRSFGVEIYEHDENMRLAFEQLGMGRLTEEQLDAIEQHTFTIYLIGKGGSIEDARQIMEASHALLQVGGLGVKIETTGKAFSVEAWNMLCQLEDNARLYDGFVIKLHAEGDVYYTCGMQNLGLRDAIVGAVDQPTAIHTLDAFSLYQVLEQPHIRPGESFSPAPESPSFQISQEEDKRYPKEDIYYNNYGLWIMRPIVDPSEAS